MDPMTVEGWVALLSPIGIGFGVLTGVVYAAGVLIVATHLSNYGVTSFQALRLRFLSAGALYCLFLAIPITLGPFVWSDWLSPGSDSWLLHALGTMATMGAGIFIFKNVLNILVIKPKPFLQLPDFLWLFGLLFVSGAVAADWPMPFRAAGAWTPHDVVMTVVFLAGLPLTVAHFARFYYPDIKPGAGGGAAWRVRVFPHSAVSDLIKDRLAGETRLLDRDDQSLRLLVRSADEWHSMEVPFSLLEAVHVQSVCRLPIGEVPSLQLIRDPRPQTRSRDLESDGSGPQVSPSKAKKRRRSKRSS